MYTVTYGGRQGASFELDVSDAHVVVRTESRTPAATRMPFAAASLTAAARRVIDAFEVQLRFPEAGVEVLRTRDRRPDRALRDEARAVLREQPDVRFAGRVLVTPRAERPVVYTENFFVKFDPEAGPGQCEERLARYGLSVKRPLPFARNAFFVQAPEGTGVSVFEIAQGLLDDPTVELCHPELVREVRARGAFPNQWHLKKATFGGVVVEQHVNAEKAWQLSDGRGVTIAVIDDGVDIDHEEFRAAGKVVSPRDVTRRTNDPRPGNEDNHGTACAGVACAAGSFGASGVAPGARLMPIRLASGLGSMAEADAFAWAADHGADVISCSWGPADGRWWDPADPRHAQKVLLPDSTRLAIDHAVQKGRGGKGCVVLFAAGNGNESVDNDGYASYRNVIAVAACNDRGVRSLYSDFGRAVWCAFPSNDVIDPPRPRPLTTGIWTTDRSGTLGYNPGSAAKGDVAGNYANDFGGTSSACPGAAGVAALVIARNPELRADEVRGILKNACDRVDTAGGAYDAAGHSAFYGFGRLNARRAVELAQAKPAGALAIRTARQDVQIRDLKVSRIQLPIADTSKLRGLKVGVDLEHTFIGDLVVTLVPPPGSGIPPVVLHDRQGGSTDNLRRTYDALSTPALANAVGKVPTGTWTLEVSDREAGDTGVLHAFTLEMAI
ncbi:MAG TPA: S8 family serine peptidase [Longimicrobium sp.]|nr:S8 family serine peptidase [Longimicrobium sp.]